MRIYFPLIAFPMPSEDVPVCDFTIQGFTTEQDAKDLYPDAEIAWHDFPEGE